jgi:aminoglycoside/choline kinase family phosphotransferase
VNEDSLKSHLSLIEFVRKALGLAESATVEIIPLSGRGSDRAFFRLTWDTTNSAILIHYDPIRVENAYYGDITKFMNEINIPAPSLILHDTDLCLMLMEDLGGNDLWALRNEPWEKRKILYEKTLAIVQRLHSFPIEEFPVATIRLMEAFGPELYKWERDYFRENFVKGVCGIELEPVSARELETELSALAGHLHTSSHSLVHRDLQSQNVMVRDEEPYLIDFQGMRFGSPFYDLGSLLCDPYVRFSEYEREKLLAFYHGLSKRGMDLSDFRQLFWEASAQRLMQALGAYGFLGLKKGLTNFLDHIPEGLANLQHAVSYVSYLPCLLELSEKCRQFIKNRR